MATEAGTEDATGSTKRPEVWSASWQGQPKYSSAQAVSLSCQQEAEGGGELPLTSFLLAWNPRNSSLLAAWGRARRACCCGIPCPRPAIWVPRITVWGWGRTKPLCLIAGLGAGKALESTGRKAPLCGCVNVAECACQCRTVCGWRKLYLCVCVCTALGVCMQTCVKA